MKGVGRAAFPFFIRAVRLPPALRETAHTPEHLGIIGRAAAGLRLVGQLLIERRAMGGQGRWSISQEARLRIAGAVPWASVAVRLSGNPFAAAMAEV